MRAAPTAVALPAIRRQACLAEVDAIAAHWHPLAKQQRPLRRASRQVAVGSDDAVPREIVDHGEDVPNEPRRAAIDVAIGADKSFRDRAYPLSDLRPPCIASPRSNEVTTH